MIINRRTDLGPGENISIRECYDRAAPRHSHDYIEFVYVLTGAAEHTINDHSNILSKGDYFLIDRNSTHEYREIAGEEHFAIINCLFRPDFLDRGLSPSGGLKTILEDFLVSFGHTDRLTGVTDFSYHDGDGFVGAGARRMLEEHCSGGRGSEEIVRHLLICMLICLVRNSNELSPDSPGISGRIKQYVAKNYMHRIRLSDIAQILSFSLTYTSLSFKRETEMSFRDYLTRVRMEKACDLLRTTEKSVSEIASMVGYEDDTFFYRAFRRCLGQTPVEYRKQRVES